MITYQLPDSVLQLKLHKLAPHYRPITQYTPITYHPPAPQIVHTYEMDIERPQYTPVEEPNEPLYFVASAPLAVLPGGGGGVNSVLRFPYHLRYHAPDVSTSAEVFMPRAAFALSCPR